jgi:hypothetical protein
MTSLGIEPMTFRLVGNSLNQLSLRVPHVSVFIDFIFRGPMYTLEKTMSKVEMLH